MDKRRIHLAQNDKPLCGTVTRKNKPRLTQHKKEVTCRRCTAAIRKGKASKPPLFRMLAFAQTPVIGFLLVLCILFSQQAQPQTTVDCNHSKEPTKIVEKHITINEKESTKALNMTVTAYSADMDQTDETPYKTALMQKPVAGWTCAISRDHVKWLGDRVYIEGIGIRKVNDLMNERFTGRVDLFVGGDEQAKEMGKSRRKVILIE